MNEAQYAITYKRAIEMLRQYDLARNIIEPTLPFSNEFLHVSKGIDHATIYKIAVAHTNYNISLFDESILQFAYKRKDSGGFDLRYAFYQNPFSKISYQEYLTQLGWNYSEVKDSFVEEYAQESVEAEIRLHSIAIRYDYSETNYKPAVHSVSHLHFGYDNTIRIPINKILTPFTFVIFVLKNAYYGVWKDLISNASFLSNEFERSRSSCCNLNPNFFNALDKLELHIQ